MKKIIVSVLLFPMWAFAAAPPQQEADFDSLGGNKVILDRAKALAPEQNITVIQNRAVSRTKRIEISPEFSSSFGGEAYSRTKSVGLNTNYHINPRWSVGLKLSTSFNTLTPEGEASINRAIADFDANPEKPDTAYPQLDYQKGEMLALVNWYPFYGKLNLMDRGVAQFDVYAIGGAGQVQLSSGSKTTYTAGAGIGFWVSKNISTRAEMRYQNYKAKYFDGDKNLDLALASFQVGWML